MLTSTSTFQSQIRPFARRPLIAVPKPLVVPAPLSYLTGSLLFTMDLHIEGGKRERKVVQQRFKNSAAASAFALNARLEMADDFTQFLFQ